MVDYPQLTDEEKAQFKKLSDHSDESLKQHLDEMHGQEDYLNKIKSNIEDTQKDQKSNTPKDPPFKIKPKKKVIFQEFKDVVSTRYEFREPQDFEMAMMMLVKCSALIHFYCSHNDSYETETKKGQGLKEWSFAQLLLMNADTDFWEIIASCVYCIKTNKMVFDETKKNINIGINKIYEVIMVFAQGIMSTEISSIYATYCSGIPQNAVLKLLNFFHENDKNSEKFKDPKNLLSVILNDLLSKGLPQN